MKSKYSYILILLAGFISSCLDSPEMGRLEPIVSTIDNPTTVLVQDGTLLFEGEIKSSGKEDMILKKGFYWSETNSNPSSNDNVIEIDSNSSDFSAKIDSVSGGKTIYWKAFAENEYGINLGATRSYSTPQVWLEKEKFNAQERGNVINLIMGDSLCVIFGVKEYGGGNFIDAWAYSLVTNRWDIISSNYQGNERRYPVAFTVNDDIYVGTGQLNASTLYSNFYKYNKYTSLWTELNTPNNFRERYNAVAFSLNNKGYVIGGQGTSSRDQYSDVWIFSPSEDEPWKQLNNFPSNEEPIPFYEGISIFDEHKAFIGFGRHPETSRSLWQYDENNDSWEKITEQPEEATGRIIAGTILKNYIYLADNQNVIWEINLENMHWVKKCRLPEVFELKGSIALFGINNSTNSSANNSIFIGFNFSKLFYQYRPFWDYNEFIEKVVEE